MADVDSGVETGSSNLELNFSTDNQAAAVIPDENQDASISTNKPRDLSYNTDRDVDYGEETGISNSTDHDQTAAVIPEEKSGDEEESEEESGSTGSSYSTDQTVAMISEEESGDQEESTSTSADENLPAISSSTNQPQDLSSNPVQGEKTSIIDFILELRRKLNLSEGSPGSNGNIDDPPASSNNPSTTRSREPASRSLPPECCCFVKKLTLTDASREDGKLDIEPDKAIWIPSCPLIPKDAHDARKSVELVVYDYENTRYNMVLTGYNYEGILLYSIDGEWRKFVGAHDLQHGDVILFCKNRDPRVNGGDFYYIILFTRRRDGNFKFGDGDNSGSEDEGESESSAE